MNDKKLSYVPHVCLLLGALYVAFGFSTPRPSGPFDIAQFGRLPVLSGGRVKPVDTVARTSLLLLRGKQTVRIEGRTLSAREWFLEMLFRANIANALPVFEIDNPDVLGIMGIQQTRNRYYTYMDLLPHMEDIEAQAHQGEGVKPEQRSPYQAAIVNLHSRINLYQKIQNTLQAAGDAEVQNELMFYEEHKAEAMAAHMSAGTDLSKKSMEVLHLAQKFAFLHEMAEFFPIPVSGRRGKTEWVSMGQALTEALTASALPPGVLSYATLGDAWRSGDGALFKRALMDFETILRSSFDDARAQAHYEFFFNSFDPFYRSMVLYVIAMLMAFSSFLFWRKVWVRSALWLVGLAFSVHTCGLISRIYLQGRPPVTNLYSSAIFVGWVAVLLGLLLERAYRNGIGSMVASAIGFATLIIAHHLMSMGDTLEMMRAVLDSNFWLATHVVCITIGYSSTFLSGFLGILYLVRRVLDASWTDQQATELESMVYGVVCFSLFFSFLGTILGGIWADQSWGRFWGWDPKENGALMIVLWNAFILHARISRLGSPRSVMKMAVFGNIVTAFSWFGVNMLGIGLHSYGFMDKAFVWLLAFTVSQVLVIGLGFIPTEATRHHLRAASPRNKNV